VTPSDPPPMKWSDSKYGFATEQDCQAKKRHKPEEIVAKSRQVDVLTSQVTPIMEAIRSIGVTEVTYYPGATSTAA
jgi:hypothetical protein